MHIALMSQAALGLAALGACGEDVRLLPAPQIRDSAGIRIVQNSESAAGSSGIWATVDPDPAVEIGAVDAEDPYLFTRIGDAFETWTGVIVVADNAAPLAASQQIRTFDEAGRHLRTFGGVGSGPGEFRGDAVIRLVPPDSILAWDPRQRRLTWFTIDGEVVREETLGGVAGLLRGGGASDPRYQQLHPDGSVVMRSVPNSRQSGEGFHLRQATLLLSSATARPVRTIQGIPAGATVYVSANDGGNEVSLPSVYPNGAWAWGVRVTPASIVVADNPDGRWALSIYDFTGKRTGSIRAPIARVALTSENIRAEHDSNLRQVQRVLGRPASPTYEAAIAGMPMPDSAPAIGVGVALIVDSRDRIWVQRWRGGWEGPGDAIYDVIDRSGRWLGSVEIATSLGDVVSIGDDHVLFRWSDAMMVPRVRKHLLHFRAPAEQSP